MTFDTSALPDLAGFAAANGMTYAARSLPPVFHGSVFSWLEDAVVSDRFVAVSGPIFEVGTVTGELGGSQAWDGTDGLVTTSYSTNDVRTYGYMAMQLPRSMPQFVLDAKRNDLRGSSVAMPIADGQHLSLEGDFDLNFLLYAPKGFERDALYVFAPDLMALLIDETGDFDVEILDDMLFVYSPGRFDASSAGLWERLARIRAVVGTKAISQTDRYDGPAEGRRLRMGFFGGGSPVPGRALLIAGITTAFVIAVVSIVLVFFPD